jgi:hypothetical protein
MEQWKRSEALDHLKQPTMMHSSAGRKKDNGGDREEDDGSGQQQKVCERIESISISSNSLLVTNLQFELIELLT